MRESLYRAKPKNSQYGDFVYGNYLTAVTKKGEKSHYIKRIEDGLLNPIEIEPETRGEETGLLDCNGELIFEGDIGKFKQTDGAKRNNKPIVCIGKVIYNAKTASFAVESKDEKDVKYFDYFTINYFEVIGTTTSNKELLKNCSWLQGK